MALKQFKSNNSRELTLQVLAYLASIQKQGLMATNIRSLKDERYLYTYEIISKKITPIG